MNLTGNKAKCKKCGFNLLVIGTSIFCSNPKCDYEKISDQQAGRT